MSAPVPRWSGMKWVLTAVNTAWGWCVAHQPPPLVRERAGLLEEMFSGEKLGLVCRHQSPLIREEVGFSR